MLPVFAIGGICGLFFIVFLFVAVAVIFRSSVSLANRCLGASSSREFDPDDEELDEWIGYRQIKKPVKAISEPGVVKAIMSVFLLLVVNFLAGISLRLIFGAPPFDDGRMVGEGLGTVAQVMGFVIGFPITAWILTSLLSTTFARACLVLVCNYVILLAIIAGISTVIYILV